MKTYISAIIALLLAGCSSEFAALGTAAPDTAEVESEATGQAEGLDALIERARWGDGQAYLELADCYREGIGVEKDFLGMLFMAYLSSQHGGIKDEGYYFYALPADDEYRLCFDVVTMRSDRLRERSDSILRLLTATDNPDVLTIRGVVNMERGDTIEGLRLIRNAAGHGSAFAELLLATEVLESLSPLDENNLLQSAERVPLIYKKLAQMCLKPDENGNIRTAQAAHYYLKAEEKALLSRQEARWLLFYNKEEGNGILTEEDVRRLEAFSRRPETGREVAMADTVAIE